MIIEPNTVQRWTLQTGPDIDAAVGRFFSEQLHARGLVRRPRGDGLAQNISEPLIVYRSTRQPNVFAQPPIAGPFVNDHTPRDGFARIEFLYFGREPFELEMPVRGPLAATIAAYEPLRLPGVSAPASVATQAPAPAPPEAPSTPAPTPSPGEPATKQRGTSWGLAAAAALLLGLVVATAKRSAP